MAETLVDYLVVGAGATAMAFVDSVFHENTAATFAIVDRRDAPGGHWNDAYPFVSLHQPARLYGAASRPLGSDRVETHGENAGLMALATGREVAAHFHALMREVLLPSGRVHYHPSTEHIGQGRCRGLLSGAEWNVTAATLVDATIMETPVPLTRPGTFVVPDGCVRVPPNDLPRLAPHHDHFVVVGAGKTAMDALLWLLHNGAPPERITWVKPRDAWCANRAFLQPGAAFIRSTGSFLGRQAKVLATAVTLEALELGLETEGLWLRVDPSVRPTMYHAASVTVAEVDRLRAIGDVVRLGHLVAVEPGRLHLEHGTHDVPTRALVVDCTASALGGNVGHVEPVFTPGRIALQMIRQFQPTFSAALIGHLEVAVPDDERRQRLTAVAPMTDTVADFVAGQIANFANEAAWVRDPDVRTWLQQCRLNLTAGWFDPDNLATARAALAEMGEHAAAAVENLRRLAADQAHPAPTRA